MESVVDGSAIPARDLGARSRRDLGAISANYRRLTIALKCSEYAAAAATVSSACA